VEREAGRVRVDAEFLFSAVEIEDEFFDAVLAAEFEAMEFAIAQKVPEGLFGNCCGLAQFSRAFAHGAIFLARDEVPSFKAPLAWGGISSGVCAANAFRVRGAAKGGARNVPAFLPAGARWWVSRFYSYSQVGRQI
jgi:hypothetical protein